MEFGLADSLHEQEKGRSAGLCEGDTILPGEQAQEVHRHGGGDMLEMRFCQLSERKSREIVTAAWFSLKSIRIGDALSIFIVQCCSEPSSILNTSPSVI